MERMRVQRLEEGLWRWTTPHTESRDGADRDRTVGSVYCETPDAVVLVDPLIPGDGADRDRFWTALDRDVARLELPVAVLLTCRSHARGAAAVRRRYAAQVWAPPGAAGAIADLDDVRVLDESASPAAGVSAYLLGLPAESGDEAVVWLSAHRALVPGDVLLGDAGGGVRLAPPARYAGSAAERDWYRDELAASLRRLLRLDPAMILVSHGGPVLAGGSGALRVALGGG
jgi:glyoxylase-like metal-dependent hydrolase (beta-lactamase superfamily II)